MAMSGDPAALATMRLRRRRRGGGGEGRADAEAQHLGEAVVEQAGPRSTSPSPAGRTPAAAQLSERRQGVGIQDTRMAVGMDQLQGLGDEFELHQPAARPLDVPDAARALFLQHQPAHVQDVGPGRRGIARLDTGCG